MSFSVLERREQIEQARSEVFDIAVVGGGITGAGVARDGALRGLKVVLLEQGDLASGTSSKSSRMIHGGLRYLEHFRLGLVHESVVERWRLMRLAPHLVRPLPFLYPVCREDRPRLGVVSTGTFIYSMLSAFRTPGPRRRCSAKAVAGVEAGLLQKGLTGAALYYDCSTNDARLTLETAMDAAGAGAVVLPRAEVNGSVRGRQGFEVSATDGITGEDFVVQARSLALAAGAWTDAVVPLAVPGQRKWLRPTKGVHLVFSAARFPVSHSVVMRSVHNDRRITFAVPWGEHTYVGTTDTDFPDTAARLTVTAEDARYLLEICNKYFPGLNVTVDDVLSVWAGIRPLVAPEDEVGPDEEVDPSDISREEKVELVEPGVVAVAGGKLTTYRVMGAHVVDRLARSVGESWSIAPGASVTEDRPLPGGVGVEDPAAVAGELQRQHTGLPPEWLAALAGRYGARAGAVAQLAARDHSLAEPLPGAGGVRMAEVHFAIRHEYVCRLEDFLVRRTYVHYKAEDQGLAAAGAVADALVDLGVTDRGAASRAVEEYGAGLAEWRSILKSES